MPPLAPSAVNLPPEILRLNKTVPASTAAQHRQKQNTRARRRVSLISSIHPAKTMPINKNDGLAAAAAPKRIPAAAEVSKVCAGKSRSQQAAMTAGTEKLSGMTKLFIKTAGYENKKAAEAPIAAQWLFRTAAAIRYTKYPAAETNSA